MRHLLVLLCLVPISLFGQDKNVLNVTRVFPKIDKVQEFEKALAEHAKKYHTGDWAWRIGEIQSGPDVGGFNIIEGPSSWDQIDKRGNLGQEHTDHWNKTVAIHLTDKFQSFFLEFKPEFSSVQQTDYSEKYAVNHVYIKPGMTSAAMEILANLKKMWAMSNQAVAVYEASSSGAPQFVIVTRYKTGLKERQSGFLKPFVERYEAANGAGSHQQFVSSVEKATDNTWSELIFTRADLGTR